MINGMNDEIILAARPSRDAISDFWLEKAAGLFGHGKSIGAASRSDASTGSCGSDLHGAPVAFAVAVGAFAHAAALLMSLYTLGTALIGHRYWNLKGAALVESMDGFYKDIEHHGGLFAVVTLLVRGNIPLTHGAVSPRHNTSRLTAVAPLQRTIEGRPQVELAERLKQALNGTSSEQIGTKVLIAVSGNKDNGNFVSPTGQFALQLRSGHARHRHVQYQTLSVGGRVGCQELFSVANAIAENPSVCRRSGSESRDETSSSTTAISARRCMHPLLRRRPAFARSINRESILTNGRVRLPSAEDWRQELSYSLTHNELFHVVERPEQGRHPGRENLRVGYTAETGDLDRCPSWQQPH